MIAVVFATVLLDLVGFGVLLPLLPLFVAAAGGSPATVGAMLATFSASQLVATPLLGRLADRVGRRRIIAFGLSGNAVAMTLFALAAAWGSLPLAFVSRLLAGLTAGTLGACQAVVSDVSGGEQRSRALGLVGAAIGLGMIVGPLLGGLLSPLGLWAPPLAAAVLAGIALGGVLVLLPETIPGNRIRTTGARRTDTTVASPHPTLLRRRSITTALALSVIVFACLAGLHTTLPLLAHAVLEWEVREVGVAFAAMGLGSMTVQGLLIGPLAARFGAAPLVVAGFALLGAALLAVAIAATPPALLAAALAAGIAAGLVLPSLATVTSELARPEERGAVLGLAQASGGLGRALGPLGAGGLHGALGPSRAVLAGSLVAGLALPLAVTLARRHRTLRGDHGRQ